MSKKLWMAAAVLGAVVISTNANSVGVLAGYINNSQITNILISADDVVVQGKNAVGMLAGIINNSNVSFRFCQLFSKFWESVSMVLPLLEKQFS